MNIPKAENFIITNFKEEINQWLKLEEGKDLTIKITKKVIDGLGFDFVMRSDLVLARVKGHNIVIKNRYGPIGSFSKESFIDLLIRTYIEDFLLPESKIEFFKDVAFEEIKKTLIKTCKKYEVKENV